MADKTPKIYTDESFGIIPLRREGDDVFVLLIQHVDEHGGHWSFPKGHKHDDESPLEGAKREFTEETGITEVDIAPNTQFVESYQLVRHEKHYQKQVIYYLGWTNVVKVTPQPGEIQDAVWLPVDQAIERLTYDRAKSILRQVNNYLTEQQSVVS